MGRTRFSVLGGLGRDGALHHLERVGTGLAPLIQVITAIAALWPAVVSKRVGGGVVFFAGVVNLGAQVVCKRQFFVCDLKLSPDECDPLE
jgi:hypothetical protein